MHPLFIPTFFAATFFLLVALFRSENVAHKLSLVIIHSILLHIFFSVVLPAGDTSGQQLYLGRIRFAFDDTTIRAWLPSSDISALSLIYELFKGLNFQASISTILARMFSLDIFWAHLFLVPVLWGVFTPIAVYLVTRTATGNETIAVLSSLLISVFPYTIYFGAISTPTSLGFLFFFFSLNFMVRYLSSEETKNWVYMAAFSFLSFVSHYLTGIISMSLMVLAVVFKAYQSENKSSSATVRASLVIAFIVSASLLPLSFIYLRFVVPSANANFTLNKFHDLALEDIVGLFLIGELTYGFSLQTVLLTVLGPLLAFLWMAYNLYTLRKTSDIALKAQRWFLAASFMIILIDYRVLKLFMSGLPINEERLWVFRDFISVPFLTLAIYRVVSWIKAHVRTNLPSISTRVSVQAFRRRLSNPQVFYLAANLAILIALSGWVIGSVNIGYPRSARDPQTTLYELEAARYIKHMTSENYVVIGDLWTVYAGEMVVGLYNPEAYYFGEYDQRRQDLFDRMLNETSPQIMIEAMNHTGVDTNLAYFLITEPRLPTEEFSRVAVEAQQKIGPPFYVADGGKLYVFKYRK